MQLTVSETARITGAENCMDNTMLFRAVKDSRECRKGDLFAAIKGAKADGHDFAVQAQKLGATAILAERPLPEVNIPVLVVNNTVKALQDLASAWRQKYRGKVVALTGTAGKTTLKDALAGILAQKGTINATEGNHNNQLGAALTILKGSGAEDFWLLEAGISHDGDMDELGRMIAPNYAIILNAAEGHTEGLGTKGVAWHKSRLLAWLQKDGIALVNSAYPDLKTETKKYGNNVIYFSAQEVNDATFCHGCETESGTYEISFNNQKCIYHTPYYGEWGAEIATCAAAVATIFGISHELTQLGFNKAKMPEGRLNFLRHKQFDIFNDTYNANPLSMRRMLESVSKMAKQDGKAWIAVLGEMGELGSLSAECHRNLGKLLSQLRPSLLVWKGGNGNEIIKGILEAAGKMPFPFFQIANIEEFETLFSRPDIKSLLAQKAVVLFKGSRFNRMEELLETFRKLIA